MSALDRMLASDKAGDWTLTDYTEGSKDDYGDESLTPSSQTIRAMEVSSSSVDKTLTRRGVERRVDVEIIVSGDISLNDPEVTEEPPHITSPDGRTYLVIGVGRVAKALGGQRLMLERRD